MAEFLIAPTYLEVIHIDSHAYDVLQLKEMVIYRNRNNEFHLRRLRPLLFIVLGALALAVAMVLVVRPNNPYFIPAPTFRAPPLPTEVLSVRRSSSPSASPTVLPTPDLPAASIPGWKVFRQGTGLYTVEIPAGWKPLGVSGDSVGADLFRLSGRPGPGYDVVVSIKYGTSNYYSAEEDDIVLSSEPYLLDGVPAVREVVIHAEKRLTRVRTTGKFNGLTFWVTLTDTGVEFEDVYEHMLSTFKFNL
jgi:hypothetical protein